MGNSAGGTASDAFVLTVTFRKDAAPRRQFRDTEDTASLLTDKTFLRKYAAALSKIHGRGKKELFDLLRKAIERTGPREEADLPWWWADYFKTIGRLERARPDGPSFTYELGIKGCDDHYFYTLRGVKDGSSKGMPFLHTPFFQLATPPESIDDAGRARGLVDSIILLGSELQHVDFLRWFDIRLHCTVSFQDANSISVEMRREPPTTSKFIDTPTKPVLVASPNVRTAIADLSEVWLNPRAKSVLICAWTGSGKEPLVELLQCAVRARHRMTMAGPEGTFQDFCRRLNADREELGLEVENRTDAGAPTTQSDTRGNEPTAKTEDESTAKTEDESTAPEPSGRGIVFLDEIHHDESHDIRTGLLRLLETKQIDFKNSRLKCENVLYVMASSEPREVLRDKREPRDLWNRIEYVVTMHHPLQIRDLEEREMTLCEYFLMFWNKERCEWSHDLGDDRPHWASPIVDDDVRDRCADIFIREFSSPLIPLISIRELRTITMRLFGRHVNWFRTGNTLKGSERKGAKKFDMEVSEWVSAIAEEVLQETDPRGAF